MIRGAVLTLLVLVGSTVTGVSAWFLLQDWAALSAAFQRMERAARGADALALQKAAVFDQVYRLNCFADGVGALLGIIIAAIGLHGLCVRRGDSRGGTPKAPAGGEP